jgi:hypothetical protein
MKSKLRTLLFIVPLLLLFAIPSPELLADNGPNHRVRNLHLGVSGGNVNDISRRFCCSGTLGALVRNASGTQYILSNNHVLGLSGQAVAGQDISQPGLIDNNCQIPTVVADFTVAPPLNSNVDCAIAQLRPGLMDGTGFIEDIGTISSTARTPTVNLPVAKSGRTTGFTTGSISSVTTTVRVRYPSECGKNNGPTFTFTNQVVVTGSGFSAGGDSGSLIVSNDAANCRQPVALLFAGSSSTTIGNPISQVLTALSGALGSAVTFVGSACGSAITDGTAGQRNEAAIMFATQSMRAREADLMSRKGVLGIGVAGSDENETDAVIVVYVDVARKLPRLPKTINGVKVRVIATEAFVAR